MNITKKEDNLFVDWNKKYKDAFVKDGVPCPEEYENAKIKITYILKDPNKFDVDGIEYGRDMRRWIYEDAAEGQGITWNNITRWTKAILDVDCMDYPHLITSDDRYMWLRKISFMNLKKANGVTRANPNEIKNYAANDADLIIKQLSIYQPDIIICCGLELVGNILHDVVFMHNEEDTWREDYCNTYPGCYYFYTQIPGKKKKTAVLNCYHPQYTRFNEAIFSGIKSVTPKILSKR